MNHLPPIATTISSPVPDANNVVNQLPDEILLMIFSMIRDSSPNDLGNISFVCRRWARVSRDRSILWPLLQQCSHFELKEVHHPACSTFIAKKKYWLQRAPDKLRMKAFNEKRVIPMIGFIPTKKKLLVLTGSFPAKWYVPVLLIPPDVEDNEVNYCYTNDGGKSKPECFGPNYLPDSKVRTAFENKQPIFVKSGELTCHITFAEYSDCDLTKLIDKKDRSFCSTAPISDSDISFTPPSSIANPTS